MADHSPENTNHNVLSLDRLKEVPAEIRQATPHEPPQYFKLTPQSFDPFALPSDPSKFRSLFFHDFPAPKIPDNPEISWAGERWGGYLPSVKERRAELRRDFTSIVGNVSKDEAWVQGALWHDVPNQPRAHQFLETFLDEFGVLNPSSNPSRVEAFYNRPGSYNGFEVVPSEVRLAAVSAAAIKDRYENFTGKPYTDPAKDIFSAGTALLSIAGPEGTVLSSVLQAGSHLMDAAGPSDLEVVRNTMKQPPAPKSSWSDEQLLRGAYALYLYDPQARAWFDTFGVGVFFKAHPASPSEIATVYPFAAFSRAMDERYRDIRAKLVKDSETHGKNSSEEEVDEKAHRLFKEYLASQIKKIPAPSDSLTDQETLQLTGAWGNAAASVMALWDPKRAEYIKIGANAISDLAKISGEKISGIRAADTIALVANVILTLINIDKPSAEQQLFEALKTVSRQVDQLRDETHARFDRVEEMLRVLGNGINDLARSQYLIQRQLSDIGSDVIDLKAAQAREEHRTSVLAGANWITAIDTARRPLVKIMSSIELAEHDGTFSSLPTENLQAWREELLLYAKDITRSSIFTAADVSPNLRVSDDGILAEILKSRGLFIEAILADSMLHTSTRSTDASPTSGAEFEQASRVILRLHPTTSDIRTLADISTRVQNTYKQIGSSDAILASIDRYAKAMEAVNQAVLDQVSGVELKRRLSIPLDWDLRRGFGQFNSPEGYISNRFKGEFIFEIDGTLREQEKQLGYKYLRHPEAFSWDHGDITKIPSLEFDPHALSKTYLGRLAFEFNRISREYPHYDDGQAVALKGKWQLGGGIIVNPEHITSSEGIVTHVYQPDFRLELRAGLKGLPAFAIELTTEKNLHFSMGRGTSPNVQEIEPTVGKDAAAAWKAEKADLQTEFNGLFSERTNIVSGELENLSRERWNGARRVRFDGPASPADYDAIIGLYEGHYRALEKQVIGELLRAAHGDGTPLFAALRKLETATALLKSQLELTVGLELIKSEGKAPFIAGETGLPSNSTIELLLIRRYGENTPIPELLSELSTASIPSTSRLRSFAVKLGQDKALASSDTKAGLYGTDGLRELHLTLKRLEGLSQLGADKH